MRERIERNLATVRARIAEACARAGRNPSDAKLIVVTKQRPLEDIRALIELGEREFAENRAQDARERIPLIGTGPTWHFIGRLQTNKAKYLPPLFAWVHSIDRLDVAEAISSAYAGAGKRVHALIQVNVSGEAVKAGEDAEGARLLVLAASKLPGLSVDGLMTMAPLTEDPEASRPHFRALRELRDQLCAESGLALPHLSMGMSGDYEVAAEEGATLLRVGSAIFE